jgi:hypothetical protein
MKPFATGRGREMTVRGKAKACSQNIINLRHSKASRYQVNYFGIAMRQHLQLIQKEGLALSAEDQVLVDKAEAILNEYCDGQDCSFQ